MHLSNLLSDLFGDLREPGIIWQVGAIVLCVAIGWGLARFIRNRYLQQAPGDRRRTARCAASASRVSRGCSARC